MKRNVLWFVLFVLFFCIMTIIFSAIMMRYDVFAQEAECILVYDDDDEPGFYDTFDYTDPQGRTVCKVRVVFHDPAEGDPNGAVFTSSGEVNGYTAAFNGASVSVWRSGSPYSISHTRVWVLEEAPPPTEIPPTDVPPTEIPPTEIPPTEATPPTATATLPPGVTPSATPPTATLIPPVTSIPPVDVTFTPVPGQPEVTPGQPRPTPTPNKVMPVTGAGDSLLRLGMIVGAALLCIVVIFFARKMRGA